MSFISSRIASMRAVFACWDINAGSSAGFGALTGVLRCHHVRCGCDFLNSHDSPVAEDGNRPKVLIHGTFATVHQSVSEHQEESGQLALRQSCTQILAYQSAC